MTDTKPAAADTAPEYTFKAFDEQGNSISSDSFAELSAKLIEVRGVEIVVYRKQKVIGSK